MAPDTVLVKVGAGPGVVVSVPVQKEPCGQHATAPALSSVQSWFVAQQAAAPPLGKQSWWPVPQFWRLAREESASGGW